METLIEDMEFGRVEIWRSKQARRIKILIKPDHLRITLPPKVTQKQGLDFLNEVREKIKQKQKKAKNQVLIIDETHPLQTLSFVTKVQATAREKVFFRLTEGILLIEYPQHLSSQPAQMQQFFRNGIDFFLRKEAKRLLPERLKQLATMHGFNIPI